MAADPIDHWRTAMACMERGDPIPPETATYFVGGFRYWEARRLTRDPIALQTAMKLPPPGRVKLHDRNAKLRQLHREHFADLKPTEAARRLAESYPQVCGDLCHRQIVNILTWK